MNKPEYPFPSDTEQQNALKERQQQESMRNSILERILTAGARERIKPEKARRLEDYLVQAARSGQLRPGSGDGGRLSEDNLVDLLDRIGEQEVASSTKIMVPYFALTLVPKATRV